MTNVIINDGTCINAYYDPMGFITDGCHKIWLIRDEHDMSDMATAGWQESDLRDIHALPDVWRNSCPLRFIQTGTLDDIVPQGHTAEEVEVRIVEEDETRRLATAKLMRAALAKDGDKGNERREAMLDDLSGALADIVCRHGLEWNRREHECLGTGVELEREGNPATAAVYIRRTGDGDMCAEAMLHIPNKTGQDGTQVIGLLGPTMFGTCPLGITSADGLASAMAAALGISRLPKLPPAGTYGPTAKRMAEWQDSIDRRFNAMSERNRRERLIEPGEEAFHIAHRGYVTEDQVREVLPSKMELHRYIILSDDAPDEDEASLRWDDPDFWNDQRAALAVEADDGSGCYFTDDCGWEESDYTDAED